LLPPGAWSRAVTEREFETLVSEIRPELVRIASRRCGRDQAEDAVQKCITYQWSTGRWKTAGVETVSGWLRHKAKQSAQDEFKGLARLRDAQRNIAVLSYSGCKHIESKPNADGEETNK
jgi:DNA-directed RNA polymerase specialized sigma24 family protein